MLGEKWVDKPDSEGWWWFKGNITNANGEYNPNEMLLMVKNVNGLSVIGGLFAGFTFQGKWAKAIVPEGE